MLRPQARVPALRLRQVVSAAAPLAAWGRQLRAGAWDPSGSPLRRLWCPLPARRGCGGPRPPGRMEGPEQIPGGATPWQEPVDSGVTLACLYAWPCCCPRCPRPAPPCPQAQPPPCSRLSDCAMSPRVPPGSGRFPRSCGACFDAGTPRRPGLVRGGRPQGSPCNRATWRSWGSPETSCATSRTAVSGAFAGGTGPGGQTSQGEPREWPGDARAAPRVPTCPVQATSNFGHRTSPFPRHLLHAGDTCQGVPKTSPSA